MKKSLKFIIVTLILHLFAINLFADTSYKVQKGDTLYSISKKYQITVAELRTANNLSEKDVLKAGQKLIIPAADIGTAAALSGTNTSKSSAVMKTKEYVVAKGDTLYGIARKNSITVPELLSLNNLDTNSVLKAGQKIKIPDISVAAESKNTELKPAETKININDNKTADIKTPDTRTYGTTVSSDNSTKWPVSNPTVTTVKGKVSGVQLSAKTNETVSCIHEGTVMYVGTYRGFGQVLFVQSKTGLIYAYTGMGDIKVKKGDYVVSGAALGTAGVDSITGKPQITFMVFQNGQPIDPAKAPRN